MKITKLTIILFSIFSLGCDSSPVDSEDENTSSAIVNKLVKQDTETKSEGKNEAAEDWSRNVNSLIDNPPTHFKGRKLTSEEQRNLVQQLQLLNNPELIAAEAERLRKQREISRQALLKKLEGVDASYMLAKSYMVRSDEDFQSIAKKTCLTVEQVIQSNPGLRIGENRIQAPFIGLILNLPDNACTE